MIRYGASHEAIAELLADAGEPRYRVDQVWDALYRLRIPLDDATTLPAALRTQLATDLPLALDEQVRASSRDGLTTKWLWITATDRAQVETVLMRTPKRATVCISSQAGCAMGCTFCATGQAGFERNLELGEIVEQVLRAAHVSTRPITNVVYMGMGEPLANYDAVWSSVERLHEAARISARRITISTVGVAPAMRRLATERLPVTLAVSLHAADDELRNELVPLNRRYPIAEVLDAAVDVAATRGRRVTFEYAAIAGVNDSLGQADRLAALLGSWPGRGGVHVNLIPLNPTAGFTGRASSPARLRAFADRLRTRGVNATVRRNRGTDIDAACGQLRARAPIPDLPLESSTMEP